MHQTTWQGWIDGMRALLRGQEPGRPSRRHLELETLEDRCTPATIMPGVRDPADWPFDRNSPWNMPVGSSAVYQTVNSPGITVNAGGWLATTEWSIPVYQATNSDPLRSIFYNGQFKGQFRVPDAARPSPPNQSGTDGHLVIVAPDGLSSVEMWRAVRRANGDLDCSSFDIYNLTGTGWNQYPGGPRAYGGSALGGLVREYDITTGAPNGEQWIHHALAVSVPRAAMNKNGPGGNPFVWPATVADSGWQTTYGSTGNLYMGSLLAIPKSVNLVTQVGLTPGTLAYKMAKAMQDYGIYVVDASGGGTWNFYADQTIPAYLLPNPGWDNQFNPALNRAVSFLKVISNNTSSTPGGGGTPGAPLAPDFIGSLAGTSTTLVSSVNPANPGQAVTFTATVSSGTVGTITGTVSFKDGGSTLATVAVSGGRATYTTSSLTIGTHQISAVYNGDARFAQSTSPYLSQRINAPPSVAQTARVLVAPVVGVPAGLSVLGSDDAGETSLTYSWSVLSQPVGATAPSFSANGTNAAKSASVTFATAGGYTLRATIRDQGGLSVTSDLAVTVSAGNYAPGLTAEFFDYPSSLSVLPDLSLRGPDVVRTDALLNYASTGSAWTGLDSRFADTFASRHSGFIKITTAGTYTFFLNSDDGSKLWVDDQLVVNNDGLHAMQEKSGARTLSAGYHRIRVEFFENLGGAGLIFSWSGPGIAKQIVPASVLFQAPGGNRSPTVAQAARVVSATPTAANLAVLGADDGGEANLRYTWSVLAKPSGAAGPSFSANASNAAKNTTATFSQSGSYTLRATIRDAAGLNVISDMALTVNQVLTSITVAPKTVTVQAGATQQFSAAAFDQFGKSMATTLFAWSVSPGGGSITSAGTYTASQTAGSYTITAAIGTVKGTATATVAGVTPQTAAEWALDGNGNDSSGNGRHLGLSGNPAFAAGRFGSALRLNGANQFAATTAGILNTASSFSVSAWAYWDGSSGWRSIVTQDGANVSGFWLQKTADNRLAFERHHADSTSAASSMAVASTAMTANTWYHVVGVYDSAAGQMRLYVNGQLAGTAAFTTPWSAVGPTAVGRGRWGSSTDYWSGLVDEVKLYQRALTSTEVAALYNR